MKFTLNIKIQQGFTLLEILFALVIAALLMAAFLDLAALESTAAYQNERRSEARWVASNVLTDLRLQDAYPGTGVQTGHESMGQREWYWKLQVRDGEDEDIRRVDVYVFDDPQMQDVVASYTTLVGRF